MAVSDFTPPRAVFVERKILAAIASPRRREILRLIWEAEMSAGAIHHAMPDVTFGAISLHLRQLGDAGLVDCRVDRRHRFYRARRDALGGIGDLLEQLWSQESWPATLQTELQETRRGPRPGRRRRRPPDEPIE
jgi:DNA-binding transcriptional ArsR family regulator